MTQSNIRNRKFVLAEQPKGEPDDNSLRLESEDIPKPGKGQMLLSNEYLSLDPYMRGRMSDTPLLRRLGSDWPGHGGRHGRAGRVLECGWL